MDSDQQPDPGLLQLPDACLLIVLRYFEDDPRSLYSAARAHSRLRQAAAVTASSIRAEVSQGQVDSVLRYLTNHGQHIDSIALVGKQGMPTLRHLPHTKLQRLSSLQLSMFRLQLQPGRGSQGVLGVRVPLKQLRIDISHFTFLDDENGLAAALALLPDLQHLRLSWKPPVSGGIAGFPSSALLSVPQLTYLELTSFEVQGVGGLWHLQGLTKLQDLRLERIDGAGGHTIEASMLSGLQRLTRLKLHGRSFEGSQLEPGCLDGMTQLQHLELATLRIAGGSAGVAQLLSHLQPLQQLTHLDLKYTSNSQEPNPPAAAYSALTASSILQHLNIRCLRLPADVCQHMLPAGRQLPHLTAFQIKCESHPQPLVPAAAPRGDQLVRCCPGLQVLQLAGLQFSSELLNALQGFSSLRELVLTPPAGSSAEGLEAVCQLTGLRRLDLYDPRQYDGLLMLGLTQLTQLTDLSFTGYVDNRFQGFKWRCKAPELLVRHVLRYHLNHSDPAVAQQAAAALEQG